MRRQREEKKGRPAGCVFLPRKKDIPGEVEPSPDPLRFRGRRSARFQPDPAPGDVCRLRLLPHSGARAVPRPRVREPDPQRPSGREHLTRPGLHYRRDRREEPRQKPRHHRRRLRNWLRHRPGPRGTAERLRLRRARPRRLRALARELRVDRRSAPRVPLSRAAGRPRAHRSAGQTSRRDARVRRDRRHAPPPCRATSPRGPRVSFAECILRSCPRRPSC